MIVEMRDKSFPVEWKQTSLRVFPSRVEVNFSTQKRGILDDNYARCNIAMLETTRYTEAANFEVVKLSCRKRKRLLKRMLIVMLLIPLFMTCVFFKMKVETS